MHFSIYKKNITPIGFCLLLYFVTFRYKKCTEPTINIFYENMCHFTTAVCLSGVARTWSRSTLQSFQDFWKYPLHVFSCMCGFLCFSRDGCSLSFSTRALCPHHSITHCLFSFVPETIPKTLLSSFKCTNINMTLQFLLTWFTSVDIAESNCQTLPLTCYACVDKTKAKHYQRVIFIYWCGR